MPTPQRITYAIAALAVAVAVVFGLTRLAQADLGAPDIAEDPVVVTVQPSATTPPTTVEPTTPKTTRPTTRRTVEPTSPQRTVVPRHLGGDLDDDDDWDDDERDDDGDDDDEWDD